MPVIHFIEFIAPLQSKEQKRYEQTKDDCDEDVVRAYHALLATYHQSHDEEIQRQQEKGAVIETLIVLP